MPELTELVTRLRAEGKRIVLTNGTFDVLHVGHVRYLQSARALGDVLVVGLNSDSSVRGYKGPGRPVVQQDERAEILAALRCVDFVTIFDEPTATHIVEALQPDVYAKGGDYDASTGKPLPEAEAVLAYGGRVEIIPYVAGRSASQLIEKMRDGTA
ncbi:MAG: D-glycero-beta-D-manno-heptose 1-phosphate adenylyltransferase [Chloroflexia bacterium]